MVGVKGGAIYRMGLASFVRAEQGRRRSRLVRQTLTFEFKVCILLDSILAKLLQRTIGMAILMVLNIFIFCVEMVVHTCRVAVIDQ